MLKQSKNSSFIAEAKIKHKQRFDYSDTYYTKWNKKVKIKCNVCKSKFYQLPFNHLKSKIACPVCASKNKKLNEQRRRLTLRQFIDKAKMKHGNKYDYSEVEYQNAQSIIKIICRLHGGFKQKAYVHLMGCGCPICGKSLRKNNINIVTKRDFIEQARQTHGNKYDYSEVNYKQSHLKVKIICPRHGAFYQSKVQHISLQNGCPLCSHHISKAQWEITNFVKQLIPGINVETSNRTVLDGKELDIYLPDYKLAIEYNGLYWHSENRVGKFYHQEKTNACESKGIHLIHIFEDDWSYKGDIVQSMLSNLFFKNTQQLFVRNCIIREVSSVKARLFFMKNHIQGFRGMQKAFALIYEQQIVAAMSFIKKQDAWELLQFCNKSDVLVVDGAQRLFASFLKKYKPKIVIAYADRCWLNQLTPNVYEQLNFLFVSMTIPEYSYVVNQQRKHKFSFRKSFLVEKGADSSLTEKQFLQEQNIFRIYNSGYIKYKYIYQ